MHGHQTFIFNLPTPLQPYQSVALFFFFFFLGHRSSQIQSFTDLFVDDNICPISKHWFQKHLKIVLIKSGIPANHYSRHSFRIGTLDTQDSRQMILECLSLIHQIKPIPN